MDANGKGFLNQSTTPAASFGCVARVNQHDFTISVFCFAGDVAYPLIPGCILNAFSQGVILEPVLPVQLSKRNDAVFIDQLAREFVRKVLAPVSNPLVEVLQRSAPPGPFGSAFLNLGKFSLRHRQFLLVPAKETRIIDFLTVAECSKAFQTNVNAYRFPTCRKRFGFDFTREVGVPIAKRVLADIQGLDIPTDRAMQDDFDGAYLGQIQTVFSEFEATLRIGKAILAPIATKTGIARFFARFQSAKESLESQINTAANFLENLGMGLFQLWFGLFPARQHLDRVVMRNDFLLLLPCIFTSGKRLVVHPTAQFKGLCQVGSLAF